MKYKIIEGADGLFTWMLVSVCVAVLIVLYATGSIGGEAHDRRFNQATFPCQEDEVLGYDARFGSDYVGCIHLDELMKRGE
jgi:hypothetical protein